ncbi:MAG: bifunctional 23S rRNA (guanine(2069)-N(7))-methyltransferase RlmK/23S rRNA (guanine(2445)-N(2))-methyltransferase RlmL [Myxococcales bacterium]|jgi:23S rRNA (guanine2445-N2)-methyltransferase / 23S rRNA (guanine2069-N7)-methyltransferase
MRFTAIAARGVEQLLAAELRALGATAVQPRRGAVGFEGELEAGYRACLFSRTASRILMPLREAEAPDEDALYELVRALPWHEHMAVDGTLAVECVTASGVRGHTRFLAQRTKDAICDVFRARTGARPSVDRKRPDLRVHVHLGRDRATIGLDLSGEAMHRRGYRPPGSAAPLKETLAAALLLHAGWPARAADGAPFCDPLCGSGTLPIEAAWIAGDVAPGLRRGHHGVLGWRGHDRGLWERLLQEARDRAKAGRERIPPILGFDGSAEAIASAKQAAQRAGVGDAIRLQQRPLQDATPDAGTPAGVCVTNPPYGERLGSESELLPLYETLGDTLRHGFCGWRAWVLTGSTALGKHLGLRPESRTPFWNGPIECRLLELPIRERPPTLDDGPAWRKPGPESTAFENRLRKNLAQLRPWAQSQGIECYRIYDADVPEYNLAVDVYGEHAVVQEYAAPRSVRAEDAMRRLRDALLVVQQVLALPREEVSLKVRARQVQGRQYERRDAAAARSVVHEGGHRFLVSLDGHLDTGLFPDHRKLRAMAAEAARGRSFLNLFAYTCSASVYAAAAGATTTSVDLSATYLEWGRDNFRENGLDPEAHRFLRDDCLRHVDSAPERFAVIFLNPPSYSRSHRMEGDFDVKRDHRRLITRAMGMLEPDGVLFFSTHARGFELDAGLRERFSIQDVSRRSVPRDYLRSPHRAFCVRKH